MKKKLKRLIINGVFLCALSSKSFSVQAKETQIELNFENIWGVNPIVENGTSLVPLRSIGDLLGANIDWDKDSQTITIRQEGVTNILTIDKKLAYKYNNDEKKEIQLSLAPQLINHTTYVPLRYIAESLDVKVDWDQNNKKIKLLEPFNYKNYKIYLGDSIEKAVSSLGEASFTMKDEKYDYLFYVDDYENVLIIYSDNNAVKGFTSNARTMKFRDITNGSNNTINAPGLTIVRDQHDGDKIAVMSYNTNSTVPLTGEALMCNERIIFELTNGFRAHNNKSPLKYSSVISNVARNHSKDMADNNYFSHTSLDGRSMSTRLNEGGINWGRCGENIAAGNGSGILVFGQWLNSLGHRNNMLGQDGELGIGSAYNPDSKYRYYHTQNFVLRR
ncbi:MAG: hypothetical protein GX366_02705 [Epulopiscium sp.]|nr:hypothetical protein [Candidatus Epulonipiscium sp.]